MGYGKYLNADHTPDNARNSRNGAANDKAWVVADYDTCIFNHGLHDIHADLKIPLREYLDNLRFEYNVLSRRCKRVVFMTTTQVPANSPGRKNSDVLEYNQAALKLMQELQVHVCDLYSFSETIKGLHKNANLQNNVHFTEEGYEQLAEQVKKCLLELGPSRVKPKGT